MQDLHKIWHHRWITPKAKSFKSPIHGTGMAAIRPIAKGEPILALGGVMVHRSNIKKYRRMMGHIGLQVTDDFFIVPTTRKEIKETGTGNHSCNPNIGMNGSIVAIAMRPIKGGRNLLSIM